MKTRSLKNADSSAACPGSHSNRALHSTKAVPVSVTGAIRSVAVHAETGNGLSSSR
ncbi:hypothetical protein [Spirillospora sp. NPDC047279]|uniref:hypothetical protein n=1 Tax=Spirillospora sp. NPDC047279 TaxID=3155478 RepID=UPI0033EFFE0B